jgi:hypothetical protein
MALRDRLGLVKPPTRPAAKQPTVRHVLASPPAPTPPPPAPTPAPAPAAPARVKKPKPDTITFRCGHAKDVVHVIKARCPTCQTQALEAMNREQKRVAKKRRSGRSHSADRLPNGAHFQAVYESAYQVWSGTLMIPGAGTFEGTAGGIGSLIAHLSDRFRATLPDPVTPVAPTPDQGDQS